MKTLILHLGMAKTGTSTIQMWLGASQAELRHQGIIYPPQQPYNHSYQFTTLFLTDSEDSLYREQMSSLSEEEWQHELDRLRAHWLEHFQSSTQGTFIVSAENLPRLSPDEIQRLVEFVAPCFEQIRAIAYIRHPLTAIISSWEQGVKELRQPQSGDVLLSRTKKQVSYQFLARWSNALGADNLIVRPFDSDSWYEGELLADFLHSSGLDPGIAQQVEEVASNQSLGPQGTAFLLAFNGRYPIYRQGSRNPERGLGRRLHLFYQVMRRACSDKLSLDLHFDQAEAEKLNREIGYVNEFLPEDEKFPMIRASEQRTELPGVESINTDYYLKLVNEFALMIDHFATQNDHLRERVRRLEQQLTDQETESLTKDDPAHEG